MLKITVLAGLSITRFIVAQVFKKYFPLILNANLNFLKLEEDMFIVPVYKLL